IRVVCLGLLTWSLTVLFMLPPAIHGQTEIPKEQRSHLLIALDVSPSMRVKDAGADHSQSRIERARAAFHSLIRELGTLDETVSVIAFYTEAMPVVIQSLDPEVVRHVMGEIPLHYLFPPGTTDVASGVVLAAQIAGDWPAESTTLLLITDGGNSVSTKLPPLPASIAEVVVMGVGDPVSGTAINGELTRQNVSSLRQLATQLQGTYYDVNEANLPLDALSSIALRKKRSDSSHDQLRTIALALMTVASLIWAVLPFVLRQWGTRWQPGVILNKKTSLGRDSSTPTKHRQNTVSGPTLIVKESS
ncbi:MAG TPA: vWA domain-containing protein, partial [Planctomicrobium sp.]|nr:vWA domain-containing protein [Planctomicrobium sp.]